jgi:KDO2-lipid IV(A) lauroyltransferase
MVIQEDSDRKERAVLFAYLQYLMLRGFSFLINLLPERWALWLGRQMGRIAYGLDWGHRRAAIENLTLAFGSEKSKREIRILARKTFENLAMTAVEFLRIPKTDPEVFKDKLNVEGLEKAKRVLQNQNKGVLLLLSHFGNWELMGLIPRILNLPISVIARPIKKNRWVDRMVGAIREGAGLDVIPTAKASRRVLQALAQNRMVGILIDQRAKRSEGIWVDFFGRKAPTTPALAVLSMRTGAPIVPVFMIREDHHRHCLLIKDPLRLAETGDVKKDVETNTRIVNETLEKMIRQYPDQWFWVHRRWERKRKGRKRSLE